MLEGKCVSGVFVVCAFLAVQLPRSNFPALLLISQSTRFRLSEPCEKSTTGCWIDCILDRLCNPVFLSRLSLHQFLSTRLLPFSPPWVSQDSPDEAVSLRAQCGIPSTHRDPCSPRSLSWRAARSLCPRITPSPSQPPHPYPARDTKAPAENHRRSRNHLPSPRTRPRLTFLVRIPQTDMQQACA